MRLLHYCCHHSVDAILRDNGTLRPNPHAGVQPLSTELAKRVGGVPDDLPVIALPVIWLTDLPVREWADAAFLGLESPFVECNRVAYRFRVPNSAAIRHWPEWADDHLADHVADPRFRALLEYAVLSDRWWVSEVPLPGCRFDDSYKGPAKETASWLQTRE